MPQGEEATRSRARAAVCAIYHRQVQNSRRALLYHDTFARPLSAIRRLPHSVVAHSYHDDFPRPTVRNPPNDIAVNTHENDHHPPSLPPSALNQLGPSRGREHKLKRRRIVYRERFQQLPATGGENAAGLLGEIGSREPHRFFVFGGRGGCARVRAYRRATTGVALFLQKKIRRVGFLQMRHFATSLEPQVAFHKLFVVCLQ